MTRAIAKHPRPGEIVRASKRTDQPGPPGGFTLGSTYLGGPLFTDAFGSRRAPSPFQLIEKYKSLIYAMVAKNANARCRVPLRLYADASRGSKPRSCCDPIRTTRGVARRLAGLEYTRVSPSAVDDVHEIRTHPILDCLDRPDPYNYFDRTKILSLISRYCDVVGSSYFMPEGNGWRDENAVSKGPPVWLWVLYSQYVLPVRMAGSPLISNFQYFAEHIPYEALIWFRTNHSLRDPYGAGFSPTYAGDMYADLEDRFVAIQDQLLGIGPRPNLIATAKDPLQPPGELERKRFEQELRQKHAGGYAGGILVNNGAWDFTPVTYSPADLAGMNISEYDMNRLCNIFGVPPSYFSTDTNLANLQAADTQHARDAVEPWCTTVASQLTSLVRTFDSRLFFAFDDCVPEDEELAARIVDMKLKNGSITINQANEETQWPPSEWGNEPWIANTLVQPSMAKTKFEAQAAVGFASVEIMDDKDKANNVNSQANSSDGKQKVEKPSKNGKRTWDTVDVDLKARVGWKDWMEAHVLPGQMNLWQMLAKNSTSYDHETGTLEVGDCIEAHISVQGMKPLKIDQPRTAPELLQIVPVVAYATQNVGVDEYNTFWKYVVNAPSFDVEHGTATLADCKEAHRLALGPPKEQAVNSNDVAAFWTDLPIPKLENKMGDGQVDPLFAPPRGLSTQAMNSLSSVGVTAKQVDDTIVFQMIEQALDRLEAQLK